MCKYPALIYNAVCFLCFFFILSGCDNPSDTAKDFRVITKKIIVQKDDTTQKNESDKIKQSVIVLQKKGVKQRPDIFHKVKEDATNQKAVSAAPVITALQKEGDKAAAGAKACINYNIKDDIVKQKDISSAFAKAVQENKSPKKKPFDIAAVLNPRNMIDPFLPLFKDKSEPVSHTKKKRKKRTSLTPLEKIDLSQLKLTGVIRASSGNKALVEEASGKGYIVDKGTYIGTRSGKVVKIKKDRIVIEEEIEDYTGKIIIRKNELKLQTIPGEI